MDDRQDHIERAQKALAPSVAIRHRSGIHETLPQYVTDQPAFLNMVVSGETELPPHELLSFLKDIERRLGRTPSRRFGPRVIDLDILYYGDQIVNDDTLEIPHPRISEREFVLRPLLEIASKHRHPVTGDTTAEMLKRLEMQK
jgi:2-amino-4-hydroxy-6-hydroxymethyldihydropteridine diphosphokinase